MVLASVRGEKPLMRKRKLLFFIVLSLAVAAEFLAMFFFDHFRIFQGALGTFLNALLAGAAIAPLLYYWAAREIGLRNKAEGALSHSEERYRALHGELRTIFDSVPATIWYKDTKNNVLRVNKAAAKVFGRSIAEIEGKNCKELFPLEAERYYRDDLEVIRSGEPKLGILEPLRISNGEERWVMVDKVPYRDEKGGICGVVVFTMDVTELKEAEDAVAESGRMSRAIFDHTFQFIGLMTPDGTLIEANRTALEFAGIKTEDAVGKPFWETPWWTHSPEMQDKLRGAVAAASKGQTQRFDATHRAADGSLHYVDFSLKPVLNEKGEVVYLIPEGRDTTELMTAREERAKIESHLQQAQKLEMVGKLAGGVAHDFNNMLTAIGFNAEYLAEHLRGDPAQKECAEDILQVVHHAASITRRLLALSRSQILFPIVLDINETVRGMEDAIRSLLGEKVELKLALAPSPAPVKADPGQIQQVLLALAINARDAMPGGGTLTISTAGLDPSKRLRDMYPDMKPGPQVKLSVSDSGVGMDADVLKHLFEPFFTTKKAGKGMGLGLSMAYGVVKQSGGAISVHSEQGAGTRFDIYLPRTTEAAQGVPAAAGAAKRGCETILLVEDNNAVRRITLRMLRSAGYQVIEARSAEEALPLAREHAGRIGLLLTDVMMPGMNGPELAKRLAGEMPGLKVLFVSGYPDEVLREEGVLEEGVQLLMKPFSADALEKKVREVLDLPVSTAGIPPR